MAFKFCPECGKKLDGEYKFCPECGYRLVRPTATSAPAVSATKTAATKPAAPAGKTTASSAVDVKTAEAEMDKAWKFYNAKEYAKAHLICKVLAEKGVARAQHMMGLCYAFGRAVPEDPYKAVYWYQKAAAQGDSDAKNKVAAVQGQLRALEAAAARAKAEQEKIAQDFNIRGTTLVKYMKGYQLFNNTPVIPRSVTVIGEYAFYIAAIEGVTIPSSVTTIEKYAFHNCSALKRVDIPGTVKTIGESAFYGCCNLATVSIGYGVESIGNRAFGECKKLTSISIPSTVKSIGIAAFRWCDSLKTITLPSHITNVDQLYLPSGCQILRR